MSHKIHYVKSFEGKLTRRNNDVIKTRLFLTLKKEAKKGARHAGDKKPRRSDDLTGKKKTSSGGRKGQMGPGITGTAYHHAKMLQSLNRGDFL